MSPGFISSLQTKPSPPLLGGDGELHSKGKTRRVLVHLAVAFAGEAWGFAAGVPPGEACPLAALAGFFLRVTWVSVWVLPQMS